MAGSAAARAAWRWEIRPPRRPAEFPWGRGGLIHCPICDASTLEVVPLRTGEREECCRCRRRLRQTDRLERAGTTRLPTACRPGAALTSTR